MPTDSEILAEVRDLIGHVITSIEAESRGSGLVLSAIEQKRRRDWPITRTRLRDFVAEWLTKEPRYGRVPFTLEEILKWFDRADPGKADPVLFLELGPLATEGRHLLARLQAELRIDAASAGLQAEAAARQEQERRQAAERERSRRLLDAVQRVADFDGQKLTERLKRAPTLDELGLDRAREIGNLGCVLKELNLADRLDNLDTTGPGANLALELIRLGLRARAPQEVVPSLWDRVGGLDEGAISQANDWLRHTLLARLQAELAKQAAAAQAVTDPSAGLTSTAPATAPEQPEGPKEAATAEQPATVPSAPTSTPPATPTQQPEGGNLGDREIELLTAMLRVRAIGPNNRKPLHRIVRDGKPGGPESSYKHPLQGLAKAKLVITKGGAKGGSWLTAEGEALARKLSG
jgi:hypothetical protein